MVFWVILSAEGGVLGVGTLEGGAACPMCRTLLPYSRRSSLIRSYCS